VLRRRNPVQDHGGGAFYSPVPDVATLPEDVWTRRSPLTGVAFDSAAQIAWAEAELAPLIAAFEPPEGFRLANRYYESVDAEVCDALVRRLAPARVVELGSGWSTLLLRAAAPGRVTSFDPFPAEFLDGVERLGAQEIPLDVFDGLEAGDVLFVDTSHTVKLGGDVNRIVLDVLPRLAPGVVVHFHDIWLPYEYHRVLVEDMGMYWAEQYLLQAFLIGNPWEVLFAAQAVAREHPERLEALVPSFTGENFPSAFWLRAR
jgi:predicted O-methyltransferase YrrM